MAIDWSKVSAEHLYEFDMSVLSVLTRLARTSVRGVTREQIVTHVLAVEGRWREYHDPRSTEHVELSLGRLMRAQMIESYEGRPEAPFCQLPATCYRPISVLERIAKAAE